MERKINIDEAIVPHDSDLFLIEFFIKSVSGDRLANYNQMFNVPTNVKFQFFKFVGDESIEIKPVGLLFNSTSNILNDTKELFNTGKSMIFALNHSNVANENLNFPIHVSVYKKMPENIKPDLLIGAGEIDFTSHFAALKKELLQCWFKNSDHPRKILEQKIDLNYDESKIGVIDLYVRMSAFGETIVTEFNGPSEKESNIHVFKNELPSAPFYQFRTIDTDNCNVENNENKGHCLPCGKETGAIVKSYNERSNPCGDYSENQQGTKQCGKGLILKVSGLFDGKENKKPTVTVAPEFKTEGDIQNPDHDVIVLKFGKKGLVGPGEKSDIRFEMKTPKGIEKRPPLRSETREIQTEETVEESKMKNKKPTKKKTKKK